MTIDESLDELKRTCARLQEERENTGRKEKKQQQPKVKYKWHITSHQVVEIVCSVLGLVNTVLTYLTIKINPNLAGQII